LPDFCTYAILTILPARDDGLKSLFKLKEGSGQKLARCSFAFGFIFLPTVQMLSAFIPE